VARVKIGGHVDEISPPHGADLPGRRGLRRTCRSRDPGRCPKTHYDQERLGRIDRLLQRYVDENRVAGAVALILQEGKPVYERAVGWADKEAGRRMAANTIFRIASQTKAFTSTAVLALVEEGKIGIDEPVSHFIPTFTNTKRGGERGRRRQGPAS
jgi:CubicO group peptidase (beta-lactamase class C family)